MSTASAILRDVEQAGGVLLLDGEELRLRASAPLPLDLLARLRERKADVVAELRGREAAPLTSPPVASSLAPCFQCRGVRFWRSVRQTKSTRPEERERLICARCHPPATLALVSEWVDLAGPVFSWRPRR